MMRDGEWLGERMRENGGEKRGERSQYNPDLGFIKDVPLKKDIEGKISTTLMEFQSTNYIEQKGTPGIGDRDSRRWRRKGIWEG